MRDEREPATRVEGLRKAYGSAVALAGLDFEVSSGEIVGVLGPNGAGKTTLINVLATLVRATSGDAWVAGHDVSREPAAVRRSIALTGQFAALDEELTARENLVLFGRLRGLRKQAAAERATELLAAFDLEAAADRRLSTFSGGMRRRTDIAVSLVKLPKVLFLDEPTTGLDPRSRRALWESVKALKDQGVTILLTTQYLEEADALADRIVVIDHGLVVAEGTPAQLKRRVGGTVCVVTPADPDRLAEVADVLRPMSSVAIGAGSVSLPAEGDSTAVLAEALDRMRRHGIELEDVSLRRPSLDDVFLALTQAAPEEASARGL